MISSNIRGMKQEEVTGHFDKIAPQYDDYKRKNAFYYSSIKRALKKIIPEGKRILDFGCGTGEILASLKPSMGVGYDISSKMIELARKKHAKNRFSRFTTSFNQISENFDYILMVDVIEHLVNPQNKLKEVLKLKMPEGPHNRLSSKVVIEIASRAGLTLKNSQKAKIFQLLPISPITILSFKR